MARNPVVLIVDDEDDVALSVQALLEGQLRYEALTADSAEKALAILASLEATPPDLVLSDYRMPRINGVELLQRVRGMMPGVPLMMMTAHADLDLAMRAAQQLHVARFLRKPLKPDELVAAVQDVVSQRWLAMQRQAALDRSVRLSTQ